MVPLMELARVSVVFTLDRIFGLDRIRVVIRQDSLPHPQTMSTDWPPALLFSTIVEHKTVLGYPRNRVISGVDAERSGHVSMQEVSTSTSIDFAWQRG